MAPEETIETAILAHQRTTGSQVERDISELPRQVPLPIAICIFRIVEEGLSNAFRHAGGRGQKLAAHGDGVSITVIVSDTGPGIARERQDDGTRNLGLRGLRQRVESIGGNFDIQTEDGRGTLLRAWIPCPANDLSISAVTEDGSGTRT